MTLHQLLTDLVRALRFRHVFAIARLRAHLADFSPTELASYRASLRKL